MNKKTIRYDGWYKSPIILDKYDLTFHNDYLRFAEGSKVEIGVLTPKNNFKVLGNGQFKIESNKIYFRIRKKVDGHESDWDGIIESNRIQFEIQNPDFEDMSGIYDFISHQQP